MSTNLRDQLQATLSGTHTLERELGGGGMSKVFVAEELRLRRKVVVKVLSPELAQGISVDRFEREIQTAAALQQANIVPVISAGDTNGLPYYTMPFVQGESLRARLARGPLAVTEVIGILRDVARALAYAHRQGVVHRDIKPDNVLISEGAAVVTDFGIAKAISASRTSSGNATLTQVGTSIGTPAYMAPEQAAGDPDIDHRADIYALGAMAYELLSGQAVFANRTPQRMLAAHMGEAPKSITEFRGDLPPALADLVMQCLAKEASDRPQQAGDIARALDSITSGSGMQSMPPVLLGGPGMLKKALAIYAGAFVAVAILAKAAIVGIGLPDWVFPGSLVVMALGLPVILWTGYVQRVARRAATATPTYTPGGTSALQHGTIATMALKAAPHLSWYKTARGGAFALGGFVLVIGAFMAMRAFGIGPFGSLLASGELKADDRVVLTDFTVSGGDSTLGRVVSDAVRAGLIESSVITVMTPGQIASGLQRMKQPNSVRLDLSLARQIAQREGAKAIVDGDVAMVAGSYIVAVRLVTADSGRELTSFRATASGPDKLIEAADQVARQLRGKAGESLRKVQGGRPLAQATTASLEALRRYSEGVRFNDMDRDYVKAEKQLREAVAADSGFAEAWRKLSVALRNQGKVVQSDSANTRAYQLRDRLNDHERDMIVGYYFTSGPGLDRARGIAAYESMLARGDSVGAMNNLARQYYDRREFARAESLYRAGIRLNPGSQLYQANLLNALNEQGKYEALDSAIASLIAKYPQNTQYRWEAIDLMRDRGQIEDLRKVLDSARSTQDSVGRRQALFALTNLARDFGKLKEADRLQREVTDPNQPGAALLRALAQLSDVVRAKKPVDAEVRAVEAALARNPIQGDQVRNGLHFSTASTFANAGRVDRARAMLKQFDAEVTDTALKRDLTPALHRALASIARAEKKWSEAAAEFRKADRHADGYPANSCTECLPRVLLGLFLDAELPDSAIAAYEAYRKTPYGSRRLEGPDLGINAAMLEKLAKMFEIKGDTARAAEHYRQFIERWKDADPEFQPRVKAARERLAKLAPVEPKKP